MSEVVDAMAEVSGAVAAGLWAAGFVCYEASPAFDPAFEVRARAAGAPPLVWFGLFERREEATPLDALPESRGAYRLGEWRPSIDRATYESNVERIRELIASGETYQANYTFRLRSDFEGDDLALYRDLCLAQRSAVGACVSTGRWRVLSASPELFVRVDRDEPSPRVTSRPMKGTAVRGRWTGQDRAAAAALVASAKDRAENAMIVDLIRNDLGRISTPGSVAVPVMFEAERYETVWQLTSTVTSHLRQGASVADAFQALFPCGSITGAPKVRAMEVIAALEDSPRGVYTGAVGWMAPPGAEGPSACFNVAIRTVAIDAESGKAEFGVGGGITWDSSPAGEYEECRAKALVLTARRPDFELLETLRFDPQREPGAVERGFVLLDRHLERLRGSAEYFGFTLDEVAVRRELDAAVAGHLDGPLRVRLTLARDGTVGVKVEPLSTPGRDPVRLAFHPEPVDSGDVFLSHKTTRREVFERARADHPDADDVLIMNERGEVSESTTANLAVKLDGRWWTPPLESGCLPGVYRAELVDRGELGERAISREEVVRAQGLAVVNSVRGWRAAIVEPSGDPNRFSSERVAVSQKHIRGG